MPSRKPDERHHFDFAFYSSRPGPGVVAEHYVSDHRNWLMQGAISAAIDFASKIDPMVWGSPKPIEPREYIYSFIQITEDETGTNLLLELRDGSWRQVDA